MEEGCPEKVKFGFNHKEFITTDSIFSKGRQLAVRYISILQWLPKYNKEDAVCDIIAGITIGLTMLPQSIAYALLAGLSPQYGLYSSFVGSFIYVILGTVKEISIGPSSLMALLTFAFTQDLPVDFVVLLTFLTGCIELLFGILRLGMLVDFISAPVVSAFTSASAIIIAEAQMKGLLGIKYKSVGFMDNTWKLLSNMHHTKLGDAMLGISSIIFLLTFRQLKDIPIGNQKKISVTSDNNIANEREVEDDKETSGKLKRALWFLTICRNALVVLIAGTSSFLFEKNWGEAPFALSGHIHPGLPPFRPPPFSTTYKNETYNFGEMTMELKSGIFIVPLVSVLVNVAIAKAYSTGGKLFATQEMVTLGLSNLAGSFMSSMPTSGAFTRSAVSTASGVRTPLAGLYTGTLIILALRFLTPYFYYIPRSTLSAVLICAVAFMVDLKIFKTLWHTNKRDFTAALLTLVTCLGISIEVGLLLGVAVNCSFLLYLWARPEINMDHKSISSGQEYLMVTPDAGLYFPSIDFFRSAICRIGVCEGKGVLPVVINCSNLKGMDFSAAKGMIQILNEFNNRQQPMVLLNFREEALKMVKECGGNDIMLCSSEDELSTLLFGEYSKDPVILKNTRQLFEEEANLPLLVKSLALEKGDERSDKT